MKLIAHRGNVQGPQDTENSPSYLDSAIENGFDVEIDVRYDRYSHNWYLGHDFAQYKIDWQWLLSRQDNLWIHCKNLDAITQLHDFPNFNFFWHQAEPRRT